MKQDRGDKVSSWRSFFGRRHLEVFCKKGVLKNFTKLIGKHLCQSLFFNKVGSLKPENLFKKTQVFFCGFCDIFKNTDIFYKTSAVAASHFFEIFLVSFSKKIPFPLKMKTTFRWHYFKWHWKLREFSKTSVPPWRMWAS